MSRIDFDEFLKNHASQKAELAIDWEKKKDDWLGSINSFYQTIEVWFKPYIDSGAVTYEYVNIKLEEDYIGSYTARKMQVNFAGQSLYLEPIGTNLIGAIGRIDMDGAKGRVQIILLDELDAEKDITKPKQGNVRNDIIGTWKIVSRDSIKIRLIAFNEDNFFDALMEIINV